MTRPTQPVPAPKPQVRAPSPAPQTNRPEFTAPIRTGLPADFGLM